MQNNLEPVSGSNRAYKKPQTKIVERTGEADFYLTVTRGLTIETLDAYRVGCTEDGRLAIPFFDENDVCQLVKFRHPEGKMLKLGDDRPVKTYIERDGRPILLGSHLADPEAGNLVIHFGDYDAMSSYQEGVPNAVSLPFGDRGFDFIKEQWDFIDRFQEIVLFPDNDNFKNREAEAKAFEKLEHLAHRLGKHRVRLVSKTAYHGAKDANELLIKKGKGFVAKAVNDADHFPVQNLVRVANFKAPEFVPGLSTGFDYLDQNVGGFNNGDLILIGGDNGAGKTTTALKFIATSIQHRKPVFLWTGEQTVGQIRYWFERLIAGPSHIKTVNARAGYKVYFPNDQYLPSIRHWYEEYFFQFDDWFIDADVFFQTAELAIRRYGCRLVVIDNLMAFTGGEGDGYFQAQGDFAQSCKRFAKKWEVPVVLICHNRKHQGRPSSGIDIPTKDDIEGSKKVTNWADTIIQCYRVPDAFKIGDWEDVDGVISLCKNRMSGDLIDIRTVVDKKSNRIFQFNDRDLIDVEHYGWLTEYKEQGLLRGQ